MDGDIVEGEVLLLEEPSDLVSWSRIRKVLEALSTPGVNTISAACKEAEVARRTFYRDIEDPRVLAKLGEWLASSDALTTGLIMARWPQVLVYQLELATGDAGTSRDATAAARFVQSELERLREIAGERQDTGPSEAAKVLQRFRERAQKVKATRTTVVEEVTLEE